MIRWLKHLFREVDRFGIPSTKRVLPKCRFRPFDEDDFQTCAEIYRLNEPGRFPDGYFNYFSEWLRSRRNLVLVCEVAGEIRGFGGMDMDRQSLAELATLNFGMVHPKHHKQGFGTALLLARLATLPPPRFQWVAYISTTGGSESFYKRFGFVFNDRFTDEGRTAFDRYRIRIYKRDWQACRTALETASVTLDTSGVVVPLIEALQIPESAANR
jgi:ribosomal-protein-alanine N-acetyltransferase